MRWRGGSLGASCLPYSRTSPTEMVWREAFLDCELLGLDGLEYGLVMVSLNRSYPTSKKHMIYDDYIYIHACILYIYNYLLYLWHKTIWTQFTWSPWDLHYTQLPPDVSLHLSIVGINNHNIDLDSARTLLSAAVLATAQVGEVMVTFGARRCTLW